MDSFVVLQWMQEQMRQGLLPGKGAGQDARMGGNIPNGLGRGSMVDRQQMFVDQLDMQEPTPLGCSPDAIKLFIGNIPKSYTEKQLLPLFETVGKVIELAIIRDKSSHTSKGCAFLWYQTRHEAQAAIAHFNKRHVLPDPLSEQDQPLVVRRANRSQRGQPQFILPEDNLHMGTLDRATQEQQALLSMLSGAPNKPAPPSVSGLTHQLHDATAALHGMLLSQHPSAVHKHRAADLGARPNNKAEAHDMPPPGCAPDAIKLFVGNIPKCYTEGELMPLFETAGKVVQLVITRDKQRNESKGSAFVWYQTRVEAEAAIIRFNMRHVLWDPTGAQDRPLEVRRAYSHQQGLPGQRRQHPQHPQHRPHPNRHNMHGHRDDGFLPMNGAGQRMDNGGGSPVDMVGVLNQYFNMEPQQQATHTPKPVTQQAPQQSNNNATLNAQIRHLLAGAQKPTPELQAARLQALLQLNNQKPTSDQLQVAQLQALLAGGQVPAMQKRQPQDFPTHPPPTQELQAARLQALFATGQKPTTELEAQQMALLAAAQRGPSQELQAAQLQAMFAGMPHAGSDMEAQILAQKQSELDGQIQNFLTGRKTPTASADLDEAPVLLEPRQPTTHELDNQLQAFLAGRQTPPQPAPGQGASPAMRAVQLQALLANLHKLNPELEAAQQQAMLASVVAAQQSSPELESDQHSVMSGPHSSSDYAEGQEHEYYGAPEPPLDAEPLQQPNIGAHQMANLNQDGVDGFSTEQMSYAEDGPAITMEQVPEHFKCPLTKTVMMDPVKAADGYTYERQAISEWLLNHDDSPVSKLPMRSKLLVPNPAMCLPSQALPWIMLLSRAKAALPTDGKADVNQPNGGAVSFSDESADDRLRRDHSDSGTLSDPQAVEDSYDDWLGRPTEVVMP